MRDPNGGPKRGVQGSHLAITEIDRPAGYRPALDGHVQKEIQILREGVAEHGRQEAGRASSRDRRSHRDLKVEIESGRRICLGWLCNRGRRRASAEDGGGPEVWWGAIGRWLVALSVGRSMKDI